MALNIRSALLPSAWLLATLSAVGQAGDAQGLFQEAVAAQQRGDNAEAVKDYRELLQAHPEAVAVRVNLGAALVDLGRFGEALEQSRMVLASDPSNRMARLNLALAYRGNKELGKATGELEQLHRDDVSDQQTTMMLADCLVQTRRFGEAVALLQPMEKGQADDPDVEWLLGAALIHLGRAPEGLERAEKAGAGGNADAYLLAGQTRLAMNQYDLARKDAAAAQTLNPSLDGLYTLTGMIDEQQGDYGAAEIALKKALLADANDFDAHLYLGSIDYFQRDTAEARVHLQRAMQLRPSSAQARYQMALVDKVDGHPEAALHSLETVVKQMPEWLAPHVALATLYYRLQRPADGARERLIVDRLMAAQQQSQAQGAR